MQNIARTISTNSDEVIYIINDKDNILIDYHTYKANNFLQELAQNVDYCKGKRWVSEGVDCEILSPNQNWQKGKIKICLQFISEQPESVLDDIRQENQ